jgi:prepilin signal peptidase PulO-like enzyme (type II secretory pathway)
MPVVRFIVAVIGFDWHGNHRGRSPTGLPFAPFLCSGAGIDLFFSNDIIQLDLELP